MSRFGNAREFIRENGIGSYADYAVSRYVTHAADKGLMRGVCSKRRNPRIIASFTSYPARIGKIEPTIKSLLMQLMKPDLLILWLSDVQFPNGLSDVPENILAYRRYGLDIRFCPGDVRSHKKYVYAMQEYPEDIVVTFDDDLIYHNDSIRLLYESYRRHPQAVSALRVHHMLFDEAGELLPYKDWEFECSDFVDEPRMDLFATTGGGTLFPPCCLPPEALDIGAQMDCCPKADDVWLKIMQVIRETPVVLARENRPLWYVEDSQDEALWRENIDGGGNDEQLARTLARYDDYHGSDDTLLARMRV